MNYGTLINRAWQLVLKHRFLWLLGLFGGSGTSLPALDPSRALKFFNDDNVGNYASWFNLPAETAHAASTTNLADVGIAGGLIAFMLAILLGLVYLSITFRGGLIAAARDLDRGQPTSFGQAWANGRQVFWRLLGLGTVLLIGILLATVILALPIVALATANQFVLAMLLGALFGLTWFVGLISSSLIAEYAVRGLVLRDAGVLESLRHGYTVVRTHPAQAVLLWLISIALSLGLGLALTVGLGLLLIPLGAIGWGFYTLGADLLTTIYATIAFLGLSVVALTAGGFVSAFVSTFWTLGYLELTSTVPAKQA